MAVQQHGPVPYIAAPQRRDDGSERYSGVGPPACLGAGGGAKQAQPEDGAPVCIDTPRRREHGTFGFNTDIPWPSPATPLVPAFRPPSPLTQNPGRRSPD